MRAVTLYLLIRRDRAEDDFRELAAVKRSICDASAECQRPPLNGGCPSIPDDFKRFLDNGYGEMGTVVDQSSYVVFRHLG